MYKLLLWLLIGFLPLMGQEISGTIVSEEGQNISFARVYISNSSNGTYSNGLGKFTLIVKNLSDTLNIDAFGFQQRKLIAQDVLSLQKITIKKSAQNLSEVVVLAKGNYAKTIIKNVVKSRNKNNPWDSDFACNLYNKTTLELESQRSPDSLGLSFAEKYSLIQFKPNNQWRETKLGLKDLSLKEENLGIFNLEFGGGSPEERLANQKNLTDLFYTNISDGNFNFYQTNLLIPKIAQTPYISPFGTLAMVTYNYKYMGSFEENGKKVHEIKVYPKRKNESVFEGLVQVEDSTWALVSVELEMNNKMLHSFKKFKIYQRFIPLGNQKVLDRQEFQFSFNKKGEKYHGSVYSKFLNYDLSEQKLRNKNLVTLTLDSAYSREKDYWTDKRIIKLTEKEKSFIEVADSIDKYRSSDLFIKEQDSIKNRISIWEILFTGVDHYNTPKGYKWKLNPVVAQANFLGIGGFRYAPGLDYVNTFKNKNQLSTAGIVNYGFNNKDLVANGNVRYTYAPKKFAQFKIAGGSEYQMLTFFENFATLFSRSNWIKNTFLELGHFHEISNGIFFDINVGFYQRTSISDLQLANWSKDLFGENNTPLEFEDYNELNLNMELTLVPFQKYEIDGRVKTITGSRWPKFHVEWEQGIPDVWNAKINYQKLNLGLDQSIKLSVLGTSKYAVWLGNYLNTNSIEDPNNTFFRGTDPYLFTHPLYSFQLLGETHRATNSYLTANYIHHFHGALVRKIPIIKRSKLESAFGAGALYIDDTNFAHSEIFGGLEHPFKIGQVKLKFGTYYAVAYSNYSDISNMIKFGLNVFNPFTNEWAF